VSTPNRGPLDQLLGELNDSCWTTRTRAARGLGILGDERGLGPLVEALGDRSAAVRREVVRALGRLGDCRALEPLIASLDDPDGVVRRHAAGALKRFGKAALAPLLDAYRRGSPELRRAAIEPLGGFRSRRVADVLLAALDDPDQALRMRALGVLVRRRESRAVDRLIAGLDEPGPWREVCTWALGRLGARAAFEPLCGLILIDNATLQMAVIKALRSIDNPRAVDLLHDLLDDEANPHRDRLARTIAALDLMGAVGTLCRKVQQGSISPACLRRALSVVHAEAERIHQEPPWGATSTAAGPCDLGEALRHSAAAMRRLEANLRELAQGD
jgi:HEAT repeat protein